MEIKRLSECSVDEGVQAWNTGFDGYFFDMTTTAEAFKKRAEQAQLSAELSIVAFEDGKPVGFVLSGIREIGGKKVAWNGGTGVAPQMRKKGLGRKLMEVTVDILAEEGVHTATLEAVSENAPAIELYKQLGYEVVDHLEYMELNGKVESGLAHVPAKVFEAIRTTPEEAGRLAFYRSDFPWQTQWQSVKDGEAVIVLDAGVGPVGYAYFRKLNDTDENLERTVMYQCEADPSSTNRKEVVEALLLEVFDGFTGVETRLAVNVPVKANSVTHEALENCGFKVTTKQIYMKKEM